MQFVNLRRTVAQKWRLSPPITLPGVMGVVPYYRTQQVRHGWALLGFTHSLPACRTASPGHLGVTPCSCDSPHGRCGITFIACAWLWLTFRHRKIQPGFAHRLFARRSPVFARLTETCVEFIEILQAASRVSTAFCPPPRPSLGLPTCRAGLPPPQGGGLVW